MFIIGAPLPTIKVDLSFSNSARGSFQFELDVRLEGKDPECGEGKIRVMGASWSIV